MISIPVNAAIQTALAAVRDTAIIRAEDGTVLGYFSPAQPPEAHDLVRALTTIDMGELRRRNAAAGKWQTTREVLKNLGEPSPQ